MKALQRDCCESKHKHAYASTPLDLSVSRRVSANMTSIEHWCCFGSIHPSAIFLSLLFIVNDNVAVSAAVLLLIEVAAPAVIAASLVSDAALCLFP